MVYLSLSLLGSFQAWTENGQQQTFRTSKERALLAYLVVEHGRRHRREKLAEMLWPDRSESAARNSLRQALYGIRQVLGADGFDSIFTVTSHEVQATLNQHVWLDAAAYDVHFRAFQVHHQSLPEPCGFCLAHLIDAVELYRGNFLEDVLIDENPEFQDWAACRREQYLQQQVQVLENLVEMYETMGDYSRAGFYMLRLIQTGRAGEDRLRRIMLLLAQNGNPGAALEQYELFRRRLLETQSRSPSEETSAAAEQIRRGRLGLARQTGAEPRHNLPELLTPFIGREMELAWLSQSLESPLQRLVCVVGPGGVGKTRLVAEAARMNLHLFPDGVFHVPLDSVHSADHLAEFIGRQVGLSFDGHQDARQTLADYLRLRRLLLVLDNFEHLLDGRGLLVELLQAAPLLKILVTSRERLHLQAEFIIELEGLPYQPELLPNEKWTDLSSLSRTHNPAVYLLLERAGRVRPGIIAPAEGNDDLSISDPGELEGAMTICRLVDGLPLGLELAAGWARDFSFAHIASEIQSSLEFLQSSLQDLPERHRSLRASFEHSWDLLTESEQEVFSKLSVFPGHFSAQAAQAVAGAAFPWLLRLADKSMVRRHSIGRYDLHPLLRQYAGQKLRQFSRRTEDQTRQAHAQYYCSFLHERGPGLKNSRQVEVLQEVELELENISAAWNWAVEHRAADLLRQAADGLFYFYETRSRWREGEESFQKAVSSLAEGQAEKGPHRHTLALLLACQGWFCCRLTRFEQADELLQRSLQLVDDHAGFERVFGHFGLGFLYVWMGRFKEAWLHLSTSIRLAEQSSDLWAAAWPRELLAEIAFESGQSGNRPEPFLETLAAFERTGDRRGISRAVNYLGNIALSEGHFQDAQSYFEKMQAYLEQIGDIWGSASAYNKLGLLAEARGEYERAGALFERALSQLEKTGDQRRMAYTLGELGLVSTILGQDEKARSFFSRALQAASRTRALSPAQDILTCVAAAEIHRKQEARAARLLQLVLSGPAADQLTIRRARRLLKSLSAGQPEMPVEAGVGASGANAIWEEVDGLLQSEAYSETTGFRQA